MGVPVEVRLPFRELLRLCALIITQSVKISPISTKKFFFEQPTVLTQRNAQCLVCIIISLSCPPYCFYTVLPAQSCYDNSCWREGPTTSDRIGICSFLSEIFRLYQNTRMCGFHARWRRPEGDCVWVKLFFAEPYQDPKFC